MPPKPIPPALVPARPSAKAAPLPSIPAAARAPVPTAGVLAGSEVTVPLAPATGDPGAAFVAVAVKPWWTSLTIWSGLALVGDSVIDAVLNVLLPLLSTEGTIEPKKLVRPVVIAAIGAVIAYRRKSENSVIGTGKIPA